MGGRTVPDSLCRCAAFLPRRVLLSPPRVAGRLGGAVRVRDARERRRAGALRVPARSRAGTSRRAPTGCSASAMHRRRSTSSSSSPRRRSSPARTPLGRPDEEQALFRTILLPLLGAMTDACGGFEWDDGVFNRVYAELERSLLGEQHEYAAAAPLVGLSSTACRSSSAAGCACGWPPTGSSPRTGPRLRASSPEGSGSSRSGCRVLELETVFPASEDEPPDAPGEIGDAVTALRLATAAPVAAGPDALRAARLASVRHPTRAADRGHRAGWRADAAGRVQRAASHAICSSASPRATRTRSWGRRSTAGRCRCLRRSHFGPSCCARRSPRCSVGRTACGRLPRGRRCSIGDRSDDRGELFARLRSLTGGGQDGSGGRGCRAPFDRRGADARRPRRPARPARRVAARLVSAAGRLLRRARRCLSQAARRERELGHGPDRDSRVVRRLPSDHGRGARRAHPSRPDREARARAAHRPRLSSTSSARSCRKPRHGFASSQARRVVRRAQSTGCARRSKCAGSSGQGAGRTLLA